MAPQGKYTVASLVTYQAIGRPNALLYKHPGF
jgi:hypothetical protein